MMKQPGWLQHLRNYARIETKLPGLDAEYTGGMTIKWSGEHFAVDLPSNASLETIVRRVNEARDALAWGEP